MNTKYITNFTVFTHNVMVLSAGDSAVDDRRMLSGATYSAALMPVPTKSY